MRLANHLPQQGYARLGRGLLARGEDAVTPHLRDLLHGLQRMATHIESAVEGDVAAPVAIGLPHEIAHGSLRLSLCEWNTEEEVNYLLQEIPKVVSRLRDMSPVWKDLVSGKKQFLLKFVWIIKRREKHVCI